MKKFLFDRWRRILWILFLLVLPAGIIYFHFQKIFACPSCYLFVDGGDGLKNYYTLLYYVQHDHGWHFSGMNYPYGEHIIYTDNQPSLALFLKFIDQHIMDMDKHVIGTMNMLLLLGLFTGILSLYLVLRRWGTGRWWALASAMCIGFLSPQLWRMHGHYGLAYICFIPVLILLLDLVIREKKLRPWWAIGASLWIVTISLIHLYFLFISLVIVFGIVVFWWLYHRKEKEWMRPLMIWLAFIIFIPLLSLLAIKSSTDDIRDRPLEPYGLDVHALNFTTTFFPLFPPRAKLWESILKYEPPNIEMIAYTGMIGLLLLPFALYFLFKRRETEFMDPHVRVFLATAVLAWLMGAGIIYQNGFRFVWELVPLLKQFRGLGRFGFAFYYLYMMVCSYFIWRLYTIMRSKELHRAGKYLLAAIFVVWGFEAWLNLKAVADPVFNENKLLSDKKDDYIPILNANGLKPEDFQAILQFPLVAIGNETMGVARGFWTLRQGMHASIETGLPLIDYAMSRTSVSQGMDLVELISTPLRPKTRAEHFDSRPLLLLTEEEHVIPAERKWVDKAQKLGTFQSATIYKLPVEVFLQTMELSLDSLSTCRNIFLNFDQFEAEYKMSGAGALYIDTAPASVWSYTDTSKHVTEYIVSFWSRVDNLKQTLPVPRMTEKDPNGKVLKDSGLHRESILWAEAYDDWIQTSFPFTFQGNGHHYELFIDNANIYIDNLMISPANDTCVVKQADMTLYNNLPVGPSK